MSRRTLLRTAGYLLPAAAVGVTGYALGSAGSAAADAPKPTPTTQDRTTTVSGYVVDEAGSLIVSSIEILQDERPIGRIQTDLLGRFETTLPLGDYRLVVSKGFEYARTVVDVTLADRRRVEVPAVRLVRQVNLAAEGWFPGDIHQHSTYSDGYQDVATIFTSNIAAGLRWGALTDHNSLSGVGEWMRAGALLAGDESYLPLPGHEVTTDRGHFNVIGATEAVDPATAAGTADVERILAAARELGGIIQLNHPHLEAPMGFADLALLPEFDVLEVWNGKGEPNATTNLETMHSWFAELNAGRYIAATGDSDNHDVTGGYLWARDGATGDAWMDRGLFSGSPRTYIHTPDGLSRDAVLAALVAGRSFVTNGPLMRVTLGGRGPGETVSAADGGTLPLRIRLDDVRGLDRADVVVDGETIESIPIDGKTTVDLSREVSIGATQWLIVEAFGAEGGYAFCNPVRVGA